MSPERHIEQSPENLTSINPVDTAYLPARFLHPPGVSESLSPSPLTGLPNMTRFPATFGYPPISGGAEKSEEGMEWELFQQSPEQWLRKHHPEWDDVAIMRAVERVEIARLVDTYEHLKHLPDSPSEEMEKLLQEIERRRAILGDTLP